MPTSLNKWPVVPSSIDPRLRVIKIPGTKRSVRVRRDAAPLFAAFLADWQRLMPERLKLDKGPVDGYVKRPPRLGQGWSNHASGTAVDVRYDVLKPDGKAHMTAAEKKILKKIVDTYVTWDQHNVLANGAWWKTVDEMHTELSQGWDRNAKRDTTRADVANVIARLKIDKNGNRPLES